MALPAVWDGVKMFLARWHGMSQGVAVVGKAVQELGFTYSVW